MWIFLDILPTLVLLAVWTSIFATSPDIKGYTIATVTQYYLLVAIISNVTEVHFENVRVQQIREGKIDYFLTRPLPYLMEILLGVLANKAFFIMLSVPLFVALWLVLNQILPIAPLHMSLTQFLTGLGILGVALSMHIMIGLTIVLLGFWFEGAEGLEHFKWVTIALFAGSIAPPALLPPLLRQLISYLPFKYLYAVPISIWQGTYQLVMSDLIYLAVVLLIGIVGILGLWRAAAYRYSSAGG